MSIISNSQESLVGLRVQPFSRAEYPCEVHTKEWRCAIPTVYRPRTSIIVLPGFAPELWEKALTFSLPMTAPGRQRAAS